MSEKIRGSVDVPLNDRGRQAAKDAREWFKKSGPPQRVITSDLKRAIDTGKIVGGSVTVTSKLEPWHLGKYEGQESNRVRSELEQYIRDPNKPVPGKHAQGTHEGESFGAFKRRLLPFIMDLLKKKPTDRLLLVTHYRDIHLIRSWIAAGCRPDLSIDVELMLKKYGDPADIYSLTGDEKRCKIEEMDTSKTTKLPFGIYIMRHGDTDWNS